jgi:glutathione peroxidase
MATAWGIRGLYQFFCIGDNITKNKYFADALKMPQNGLTLFRVASLLLAKVWRLHTKLHLQSPGFPGLCYFAELIAIIYLHMENEFYRLSANTPKGSPVNMSDYKGKVVLIVNTATQCGFTPQLAGLEKLYERYKDRGLVVLGFPCNQFGHQEPLTNDVMEQTCQVNYGVTFPLFEKSEVNGPGANEVFRFLKKKLGGLFGSRIKWNFTKFLVNAEGTPVKRFSPVTKPEAIEPVIVQLLGVT